MSIAGARNETVAFQIVIPGPARAVDVSCTPLTGDAALGEGAVSFHLVAYVKHRGKFYADLAVPLKLEGVAPFAIPYRHPGLIDVPGQAIGVVMAEVKIPPAAKAGVYEGKIRITGDVRRTLKLRLTVWDFAMPARPSIVLDFNSYGSPVGVVTADNRNPYRPTPPATIAAEHEFYRTANRHRAFLNIMPCHSQRGKPYYAPALTGQGADMKADWTEWDKRFGGVLDGSIFDDRQPVPYFYLPHNLHWPHGYSHDEKLVDNRLNFRADRKLYRDHTLAIKQRPEYLREWEAIGKLTVDHLAARGWTTPVYQVYLNHTNQANANSPWRLDEPYDRWGFRVLNYYARLTHRTLGNDKGVKVKYRLDIGHFYCRQPTMRCYKAKRYDLPLDRHGGGPDLLEPVVDLWYIGSTHVYGNRRQFARVGALDGAKEMFMYGGGQSIADSGTMHRSLMWSLWDYGARGYCTWNQGCQPADRELAKTGQAHVWYSGKGLGVMGPLPSLRMKLWRRGSYDAEYLRLASDRASRTKAQEILKAICSYRKTHSRYRHLALPYPVNNPEDYELARLKLASLILGRNLAGSMQFKGPVAGPPNTMVDQITGY
ncbi:MAG: hypothetical protein ACYS5V_10995 [Planctomycetota bacterium]